MRLVYGMSIENGISREFFLVESCDMFLKDVTVRVGHTLDAVSAASRWSILACEPLPVWVNDQNRVVLLGDSCHPLMVSTHRLHLRITEQRSPMPHPAEPSLWAFLHMRAALLTTGSWKMPRSSESSSRICLNHLS